MGMARQYFTAALAACLLLLPVPHAASINATFTINNDRFIKDGKPFQIISGRQARLGRHGGPRTTGTNLTLHTTLRSIHYFRIHPALWKDRLERVKALGLNAITVYVAWNVHEPHPGHISWEGEGDLVGFLTLAADLGLLVVLRPGPYICAEWDFGGLPWWLASSKVAGGRTMALRTADPVYLAYVDRWWSSLFEKIRPLLYEAGGPIALVQIENEYGFCGSDKVYLRHLVQVARAGLGTNVLLFTTDPAHVAARGSLPGGEIFTAVDFGPGWFNPDQDFGIQKSLNAPGLSPPFNSEFYSGWLSHWGESMANTSTQVLVEDTRKLLLWGDGTASLSFYMIHGGTNFGFAQGANVNGRQYQPHITSYDYDAPISEAGDYCQPGIGGECKYQALRDVIQEHTGVAPPAPPPRPRIHAYGTVALDQAAGLLDALPTLSAAVPVDQPDVMEEYGQRWGLVLYRHRLPAASISTGAELDLGIPPHDYATVFLSGKPVGRLDRSNPSSRLALPALGGFGLEGGTVVLDILVEAMGRQNFGCDTGSWDLKGLLSPNITFKGEFLLGWEVFPLELGNVTQLPFPSPPTVSTFRRLQGATTPVQGEVGQGPTFYRGTFEAPATCANAETGLMADTYMSLHGWSKGIAWVNGFNLGWHWARVGPQMTLYVPGPVLRQGSNEVILLELEEGGKRQGARVTLESTPDFHGPKGAAGLLRRQQAADPRGGRGRS